MDGADSLLYRHLRVLDRVLQEGRFFIPTGNVLTVALDVLEIVDLWNRLPAEMPDPESDVEGELISAAEFLCRLTDLAHACPPTTLALKSCVPEGNDYACFYC